MQTTIRTYLNEATMLIIAHRINTVIDASRILVMADGEVRDISGTGLEGKQQLTLERSLHLRNCD